MAISIGLNAGAFGQGEESVAIGKTAGQTNQIRYSVAVGGSAASDGQKEGAVAIGASAGNNGQGENTVAIGRESGKTNQGTYAIAIGKDAGFSNQGECAIAIGHLAGRSNQGAHSIAIGRDAWSTYARSIVLNASQNGLSSQQADRCYIKPIRPDAVDPTTTQILTYNSTTCEVFMNTSKTFVIDHPQDKDKYLVHACLEGPEAGVYYRGEGRIEAESACTEIVLPEYVKDLATDFTIQLTPVGSNNSLYATRVDQETGVFKVYGHSGEFFWHVYGKRQSIEVEPLKSSVELKGSGPYTWIE